mgnify:CR=1 FL=1
MKFGQANSKLDYSLYDENRGPHQEFQMRQKDSSCSKL